VFLFDLHRGDFAAPCYGVKDEQATGSTT